MTGGRIAEVQTLCVAPAERNGGVGTLLLDTVDAELATMGINDLIIATVAANTAAQRLYERRGLRPIMVQLARFGASPPGMS
ncbi:GNAT family N-acetyltransferase [Streptomyces gobiensis]|uniref:GNAT family N-acetyltransferase n=1 Tax=Streptomyces gobiensis TaxID=2875706 RepID=UPI001E5F41D9|nr:GNAT family N-acetyltransferase [Streptomyces gobiensis]UGY93863.1 GNAT family N-acetyltransferase [Streptomyces gobiensis]